MIKTLPTIYVENAECLVEDERRKFHWLSVDDSVQIIVEDWWWNDKLSRGEGRESHSFSIAEIVEIIVERVSRKKRYFLEEPELWISLTFDRRDWRDHCRRMDLRKTDLVGNEKGILVGLSADCSVDDENNWVIEKVIAGWW